MTATTADFAITRTPLGAEQYRVVISITGTTNALDSELFVFETSSDAYVSVATRYTLETAPVGKQAAIDAGSAYYRGAQVLRDSTSVEAADVFVQATIARISYLCLSIDRTAQPFTGTDVGTAPTDASLALFPYGGLVSGDTLERLDIITIKAGSTLTVPMRWSVDGVPVDLTGALITSQVRLRSDISGGPPVDTLTCTIDVDQVTNTGRFVITATDVQTDLWPITTLACDVRIDSGSSVAYTDTFEIAVTLAVTQ